MHYRWRNRIAGVVGSAAVIVVVLAVNVLSVTAVSILGVFIGYWGGYFTASWIGRTWYWYQRGGRQQNRWRCPTCGQRRWRTGGDWMPRCYTCGWKPGIPAFRWLRYSVPARQLYRSVSSEGVRIGAYCLVLGVLTLAALSGGAAVGQVSPAAGPVLNDSFWGPGEKTPVETATPTGPDPSQMDTDINYSAAEVSIAELINEERRTRGLEPLQQSPGLSTVARNHSRDMHNREFYAHKNPDGDWSWNRVANGDVPVCTDSPSTTENIHRGYTNRHMSSPSIDEYYYTKNATNIAKFVVDSFNNSEDHRENMLDEEWDYIGVGVYITEGKFYVTVDFC